MNKLNDAEDSDIDNDEYSENYEVEVLSEVNLDKYFMIPDELEVTKQFWKTLYKFIDKDYLKKQLFQKYFILKYKIEINETLFITVDIQNIQHIGLKLFSHVVKIKGKLIRKI